MRVIIPKLLAVITVYIAFIGDFTRLIISLLVAFILWDKTLIKHNDAICVQIVKKYF